MYRGRLSKSPPKKEVQNETTNLFSALGGDEIGADKADTGRGIRGLSRETEQYARSRGTPEAYKNALDRILSMSVKGQELEWFLRKGKIGEYAP